MGSFRAMFDIVIGTVLAGVVYANIAALNAATSTPTGDKVVIALLGTIFVLGLLYDAAKQFGMIDAYESYRARKKAA